jgi:hypothetical protein
MMKIYAMIILMLLAAWLGEVARIFGFKPFSLNSDSRIKAIVASSYPSIKERTPEKVVLEMNECLSRITNLEKNHGPEVNLKRNVSVKPKASDERSDELLQTILRSLKVNVLQHEEKSVMSFEPLGHSPRIGHGNPPGSRN